jgi:hypothetical protein
MVEGAGLENDGFADSPKERKAAQKEVVVALVSMYNNTYGI